MIAYFDTSAFLKLILTESGAEQAQELWRTSELVVSSALLYAECRAGLAMASRMGRLPEIDEARRHLDTLWPMVGVVQATIDVVERAGALAEVLELRGYDSVQLACAEQLMNASVIFVSADQRQCDGAAKLGMDIAVVV